MNYISIEEDKEICMENMSNDMFRCYITLICIKRYATGKLHNEYYLYVTQYIYSERPLIQTYLLILKMFHR